MSTAELNQLKSPPRKLIAFFMRSRNGWKEKLKQAQHQVKLEKNQARAVERSRLMWRTRAENLEKELNEARAALAAARCEQEPDVQKKLRQWP